MRNDKPLINPCIDSSATSQDYMNSIYLISVNRSLRQVSLATWGNPAGGFGGFSLEPGKYHARRLLKKSATGELSAEGEKPGWELLDEYKVKLRSYYPPATEVPRGPESINRGTYSGSLSDQDTRILNNLVAGTIDYENTGNYYHRELPSTSLSYKTDEQLFPSGYRTKVTQLSGWRNRLSGENHYIKYHEGVDFARVANQGTAATENQVFLAPEDGIFYIWRSEDWLEPENIPVYDEHKDDQGLLALHSSEAYGYIGVLVTRPDNPKEGRVYLFAHMGGEGNPATEVSFDAEQLAAYINPNTSFPIDTELPDGQISFNVIKRKSSPVNARYILNVKKGTRLGYVGSLGAGTGKHIHMEVHEYFSDPGGWFRIDPLSCFDESLFTTKKDAGDVNSYGWWSRLAGDWTAYNAERENYVAASDADAPLMDTTMLGDILSWFQTKDCYSYSETWIYYSTEHTYPSGTNPDGTAVTPVLGAIMDKYNSLHNKQIDYKDCFKEDRWDARR